MIYGGTGHRPQALVPTGSIDPFSHTVYERLVDLGIKTLRLLPDVTLVISGMALGWDQALAEAAYTLDIPFLAAVPFVGQEAIWAPRAKGKYLALLSHAKEIVVVSHGGYSPAAMHARNAYMVDHSDAMLALFNGASSGGTYSCVQYALKRNRQILNLWSSWVKHSGFFPVNQP